MAIPPTSFLKYDISDIACYPGSGTVITDLNANLDGTITSAGLFVSDGQQSYINITTGSERLQSNAYNFPVRNVYTISSIFKISAQNAYNTCLSLAENDGSGTVPFFGVNFNNTAEFNIPSSSNGFGIGDINGNLKLQNDTWNLLTLTADGTTQKLYLNGILVGSVAHTASFNGANPRLRTGYPGTAFFFAPQKVAIMQMWESALTAAQVKDLADSYRTRFSLDQPVVSYDFSVSQSYPGSGSTFYDLAGSTNGNTNSTTFVSDGPASYFTTNGSSTYLSTSSYTPSSSTVFSYHLWCQLNNNTFGSLLKLGGDASTYNTPAINVNDPSTGRLLVSFGYGVSMNNPTETIPIDTWTLVSVVCDGTTNKVYYDGVLVNSISQSTGFFGNGSMLFGRFESPAQYSSAKFALFNVYNTALSDSDVTTFYNDTVSRFAPPTPVIEYDFSDTDCYPGTGNTIFNLQPASYDFPIVNGATFVGAGSSSYFTFNGVNQYIGQGFSGGPGFGTTFTATVWVQANNGNVGAIWNSGFDSPLGREPGMYLNARAYSPDPGYADASFNFGIGYLDMASPQTIGDWFNLAYVADGTNVSLYVNGVLDSTGSQGGGEWPAGGFVLGARLDSGGNVVSPFLNAKIGYYSVFDVAIGSTQVSDIYNSQVSRFPSPPAPPSSNGVGGRQFAQGFNG